MTCGDEKQENKTRAVGKQAEMRLKYSVGQKYVVRDCVIIIVTHATLDHVFRQQSGVEGANKALKSDKSHVVVGRWWRLRKKTSSGP